MSTSLFDNENFKQLLKKAFPDGEKIYSRHVGARGKIPPSCLSSPSKLVLASNCLYAQSEERVYIFKNGNELLKNVAFEETAE